MRRRLGSDSSARPPRIVSATTPAKSRLFRAVIPRQPAHQRGGDTGGDSGKPERRLRRPTGEQGPGERSAYQEAAVVHRAVGDVCRGELLRCARNRGQECTLRRDVRSRCDREQPGERVDQPRGSAEGGGDG